jgi:hypothetical protein
MWWFKARRAHTVLPAAVACFLVFGALVQDVSVVLPSVIGKSQIALSLFVPIPLVCGLMVCLESRLPAAEASGTRAIALMDAALTTVCLGIALGAGIVGSVVLDMPLAVTTGRNACFLAGLMLCGRAVIGQTAVMLPVAWLVLVVFVGFRGPNDPYPWALVPEPSDAVPAAIGAAFVVVLGIFVQMPRSRSLS